MKYIFFCALLFLFSCNVIDSDKKYFNGNVTLVNTVPIERMDCDTIRIEGLFRGSVFVYDSLLFYYQLSNNQSEYWYDIYNLKNQSLIGTFCGKGGGPNEFVVLTTIFHFYKENDCLKTLLYAPDEKKLIEWNITESIKQNITVFDTILPYDYLMDDHINAYSGIFRVDENTLFTKIESVALTWDLATVSLPVYEKRTIDTNQKLRSYSIYKEVPKGNDSNKKYRQMFLRSIFCIKPDLSKMVQMMVYIPQINILDINSGIVDGFRLKGFPDLSVFKTREGDIKANYTGVGVTDKLICVLSLDLKKEEVCLDNTYVYIYNWDGELIKIIDLGGFYNQILVDEINNILYVRELHSEEILCYKLDNI